MWRRLRGLGHVAREQLEHGPEARADREAGLPAAEGLKKISEIFVRGHDHPGRRHPPVPAASSRFQGQPAWPRDRAGRRRLHVAAAGGSPLQQALKGTAGPLRAPQAHRRTTPGPRQQPPRWPLRASRHALRHADRLHPAVCLDLQNSTLLVKLACARQLRMERKLRN
jgi:hypothetical protein